MIPATAAARGVLTGLPARSGPWPVADSVMGFPFPASRGAVPLAPATARPGPLGNTYPSQGTCEKALLSGLPTGLEDCQVSSREEKRGDR